MKKIIFCLFLLPFSMGAQDNGLPKFTVKTNALSLLSPFARAAVLSSDIRLAERWSADIGVGYLFDNPYLASIKGESFKGSRVIGGVNYFYREYLAIGLEGRLQSVVHQRYISLLRQGSSYVENRIQERKLKYAAATVRFSKFIYFGKENNYFIQSSMGLGAVRTAIEEDLPPDSERVRNLRVINFERSAGIYWTPNLYLSVHFGMAFR